MHRYTRDEVARDLNYEIHVVSVDGSRTRRLTANDSHEASPVWSPDGTRIAYWSDSPEGSDWALMTMASDGTDKRQIATVENVDPSLVRWSPDGQHLAYVGIKIIRANTERNTSWDFAIYVVGADGSIPTRLAPTSSPPLWSHDGNNIFFTHAQEDATSEDISTTLHSIRPDGTDLRNVADIQNYRPPFGGNLDWSTDGSEIGYYSASYIISIKVDGSSVSRLRAGLSAGSTRSARSPDGATVAVQVTTPEGLGEGEDVYLFLMDPDGSNQRALLRRTTEGMVGEEGIVPVQLIDWEMTQYTPSQEQDPQTTATAG